MDAQTALAALIVLAAAGYLLYRTLWASKSGCAGCHGCGNPKPPRTP